MAVYKLHVKRDGGNKNLFLYLAASFFLSYRLCGRIGYHVTFAFSKRKKKPVRKTKYFYEFFKLKKKTGNVGGHLFVQSPSPVKTE